MFKLLNVVSNNNKKKLKRFGSNLRSASGTDYPVKSFNVNTIELGNHKVRNQNNHKIVVVWAFSPQLELGPVRIN